MYKDKSIRQIFDKLAHSSIMKLNETSMSKLYSLMVMGVKYQLLRCVSPKRFYDVTLQHLSELRSMCDSKLTDELLDDTVARCERTYGRFTFGDWILCKQQLVQFFQGRKVRVSLFLQQQFQATDGTLSLDPGGALPEGADAPGTLRRFRPGSRSPATERLTHPLLAACASAAEDHGVAAARALGSNMYTRAAESGARANRPPEAKAEAKRGPDAKGRRRGAESGNTFRLALFDGDDDDAAPPPGPDGFVDAMITLDGNAQRKSAAQRMDELGLDDKDDKQSAGAKLDLDDGDDLLDLTDSAK
ncbi:organic solute transport protein 1 [Aureococcus anophagefferens]|nr:organic solute transport protein 1 [Aureococcus anophagefferens]